MKPEGDFSWLEPGDSWLGCRRGIQKEGQLHKNRVCDTVSIVLLLQMLICCHFLADNLLCMLGQVS